MKVPFLDLAAANRPWQADIEAALARVVASGNYILGAEVEAFEAEWAAYCGTRHCVGTGNALDALRLMLMASGIGPGDEVIVPANTYIATWLAVSLAGATPVPVEPIEATHNIDPAAAAAAVTPRTRAIIAVHLYGMCADMQTLRAVAAAHGLQLFEDAAQAHGARYQGALAGNLGGAAAFSFYPTKNLGALGDAGCVTTNDDALATRIRRLRNYGGVGRLDHTVRGINSRLDEMQAAILRAKLPHLARMNSDRRHRAGRYYDNLRDTRLLLPEIHNTATNQNVWHQYVVRSLLRDDLQFDLAKEGIETIVHYPVPPHLEPAYADLGFGTGAFPIAERLSDQVLSLPIGYGCDAALIGSIVERLAPAHD